MNKVKMRYTRGGKVKSMHPRFAEILQRVGLVVPFKAEEKPKLKPVKPQPKPVKETEETETVEEETEEEETETTGKRKYKRRDMRAE